MKSSTLIKWAAGLSGAVLFTGFVGYISHDDENVAQASARNDNTASTSDSSDTYTSDDVFSQWGGRRSFGSDTDRDGDRGGLSSGTSDDSASSQGSSGRLHTRGS